MKKLNYNIASPIVDGHVAHSATQNHPFDLLISNKDRNFSWFPYQARALKFFSSSVKTNYELNLFLKNRRGMI